MERKTVSAAVVKPAKEGASSWLLRNKKVRRRGAEAAE